MILAELWASPARHVLHMVYDVVTRHYIPRTTYQPIYTVVFWSKNNFSELVGYILTYGTLYRNIVLLGQYYLTLQDQH